MTLNEPLPTPAPLFSRYSAAPDVFGRMVRQGYPMVYRPSEIAFLELATVEGYFWQKVQIRDSAGDDIILWRIKWCNWTVSGA